MDEDVIKPRCYECLSYDVAVKIIDLAGCEHWLCAEDWAAAQELSAKVQEMLREGMAALEAS